MLSCCPCEGRISGIVDAPNACCTLAIPVAIFDQVLPRPHLQSGHPRTINMHSFVTDKAIISEGSASHLPNRHKDVPHKHPIVGQVSLRLYLKRWCVVNCCGCTSNIIVYIKP